jgi:hypothetical protein
LAHKEEGSCPLIQHQAWIQALRQRHPTEEKRTSEPVKEGVEPNVLEAYVLDGLRIKEEFPIAVPSVTSYACAHKVSSLILIFYNLLFNSSPRKQVLLETKQDCGFV